jgi:hypothetical protein
MLPLSLFSYNGVMTYALAAPKDVADGMQEPILMIGVLKFHIYEWISQV